MQWLANVCVRRPIFAIVLIAVFVVVGLVGYKSLGVDKFPKVDFPLVTIVTPYTGASPGAVETDVTQKIEEAVNTVNGLDTLTSVSTEGVSLVIAQFDLEVESRQGGAGHQRAHRDACCATCRRASGPRSARRIPTPRPSSCSSVKGPPGMPTRELTRFADK